MSIIVGSPFCVRCRLRTELLTGRSIEPVWFTETTGAVAAIDDEQRGLSPL